MPLLGGIGVAVPGGGAAGQQVFRVDGRVRQVRATDTVPAAGGEVTLHQVRLDGGSPVDSGRTDANGRFALRVGNPDTTAMYIVSAVFRGITYFSSALNAAPGREVTSRVTVFVYDTTSIGAPVRLAQRHVVIRDPDPDGSRPALELLVLSNPGTATRIAPDSTHPVWRTVLPNGVLNLEVADGDISPEALRRRGDTVEVVAPMPPGEKQLIYGYIIPAGTRVFRVPIDQPVGRFQVLVEDTTAVVEGATLVSYGVARMDTVNFARYEGPVTDSGTTVTVRFTGSRVSPVELWWLLVVLAGLALALALWRWHRGRPPEAALATSDDPDVLAARIAALDEELESGSPGTEEQRAARQRLRAELKARLVAALARAGSDR